jgi:hypothetical protein
VECGVLVYDDVLWVVTNVSTEHTTAGSTENIGSAKMPVPSTRLHDII